MTRKSGSDDYVRVPLPDNTDNQIDSDPELSGIIDQHAPANEQSKSSLNAWNFEFYRQYFDVDTHQVLRRLTFSVFPSPRTNLSQGILKPRADLYGPFWIATTLILASAVGGNMASYLQSRGRITSWHYDFKKVTLASIIIYAYWWLVPLGLVVFFYMRSRNSRPTSVEDQAPLIYEQLSTSGNNDMSTQNFVHLLSIYGYSLAVFVPVSILWIIPNTIFQWILVAVAIVISGAFLTFALFPTLLRENRKFTAPLVIFVVVLHCLFSIGLMLTFFYGSVPVAPNQAAAGAHLLLNQADPNPIQRSLSQFLLPGDGAPVLSFGH